MDELDGLFEELERRIGQQKRSLYSAQVLDHAHSPRNFKRLKRSTSSAVVRGWCGDTMEIYLRADRQGRIREATFVTDGCGPTMACGSMLTSMARGKLLGQALEIATQDLIDALRGLPEESLHCAELAVNTLRAAIAKAGCDNG